MKRVVVDPSVALKWFFRSRDDEADVGAAIELLRAVSADRLTLVQPPHFIAEVAAVLAREAPRAAAAAALRDLLAIEMTLADDPAIYGRSIALAARFDHHVFDTLYHAVALETEGATLVTADRRYLRKARSAGRIAPLSSFALS